MTDIVLVNPNNRIDSPFAAVEPPLWAGVLASYYRDKGNSVAIIDAEAMNWDINQTVWAIKALDPKQVVIVVMGNNPAVSSTPKMPIANGIITWLHNIPIFVTGLHPSALPEQTEAELGVKVLDSKVYEHTPPIAWDLLPMDKYKAHNWHCLDGSTRSPYASVYTSLGCPFNCSFCNIHALYGGQHKVWYREPYELLKEIDTLVTDYGVRNIKFWDELFTLNHDHVLQICNRLIDRDYDLNIWAYARVDRVSPLILATMKDAGINWLSFGFESGNNSTLDKVSKKAMINQAIEAVRLTHDAGISIIGNFIFGLPGETQANMQETLEFAKSLELEYANFYVFKAYPGSKLYKDSNIPWHWYNQFHFKNSEVTYFRDKAFNDFFTDPNYLARIKNKFGNQGLVQVLDMLEGKKPVMVGL